jgi:hypothetical protein
MPVSTGAAVLGSAVIGAGASLLGGRSQSKGVQQAADTSAAQNQANLELQRYMYDTNRAMNEPWRAGGTDAIMNLRHYLMANGLDSSLMDAYQEQPFNFETDPGYEFRRNEGQNALQRSAAARGSNLSGSNLKALSRYNQDYASGEYNNAFNRWSADQTNRFNRHNTTQTNQYNRLAGLAGVGQQAVGQVGNAGANYANAASNSGWQNANNQGNAAMVQGNINSSMYGGVGNALAYGLNRGIGSGLFGGEQGVGDYNAFSWQPDAGNYTFGTGYEYGY